MIMNIVIAFFVIKAILFVFEVLVYRLQNDPEAVAESLKFEIENNLVRIARENKDIADMHARFDKSLKLSR